MSKTITLKGSKNRPYMAIQKLFFYFSLDLLNISFKHWKSIESRWLTASKILCFWFVVDCSVPSNILKTCWLAGKTVTKEDEYTRRRNGMRCLTDVIFQQQWIPIKTAHNFMKILAQKSQINNHFSCSSFR